MTLRIDRRYRGVGRGSTVSSTGPAWVPYARTGYLDTSHVSGHDARVSGHRPALSPCRPKWVPYAVAACLCGAAILVVVGFAQ